MSLTNRKASSLGHVDQRSRLLSLRRFFRIYSEHASINWLYDPKDTVVDTNNGPILSAIFEKHIPRFSNWTVSRQFREYFSEWTFSVYVDD